MTRDKNMENGFFKRAVEWFGLIVIVLGWGITVGVWSNRLQNVEAAVVKTTSEVEVLKTNQIRVMSDLPNIKESLVMIQKSLDKIDNKLEKHMGETK